MPDDKNQGQTPADDQQGSGAGAGERQFPETVVKELREESARYRVKAREAEQKAEELAARLGELQSKLDGIDLEAVSKMREELARIEKEKEDSEKARLLKEGQFDELLRRAKEEQESEKAKLVAESERRLAEAMEAKKQLEARLADIAEKQRRSAIQSEIVNAAAKAQAIDPDDILFRLDRKADLRDVGGREQVVLLGDDGEPLRDPVSGVVLSIEDYVTKMRENERTAHLFASTTRGAGSTTRATPASGAPTSNPWKPETMNLTEQGKLIKSNPELAKRLAADAGVTLAI